MLRQFIPSGGSSLFVGSRRLGFCSILVVSAAFWLSFVSTSSLRFRAAATLPSRLLLMKTTYSSFEILRRRPCPSLSASLSTTPLCRRRGRRTCSTWRRGWPPLLESRICPRRGRSRRPTRAAGDVGVDGGGHSSGWTGFGTNNNGPTCTFQDLPRRRPKRTLAAKLVECCRTPTCRAVDLPSGPPRPLTRQNDRPFALRRAPGTWSRPAPP